MRVLVTGGAGFIGSHVVDKLLQHGVGVRIFDQVRSAYHPEVEHYAGSVLDLRALRHALNGVTAVIHLAAVADVRDVYEDPVYAEEVNTRGTLCVLEACRRAKTTRVIYGSTTWVYSDCPGEVVDEETPIPPPSHLYTATKYASELYCIAYSRLYGLDYTILRFGIPYGPRSRDGAVLPTFVRKALAGEPITIAGDGQHGRNFVYVEDLAEGVVLALRPAARNRIYNLDGDRHITIQMIAETVRELAGDVAIEYVPARPGDYSGKQAVSRRVQEELGWRNRVSFEEGARRYLDWYQARLRADQAAWENVDAGLRE